MKERGKLYLIPVLLGDETEPSEVLPLSIRYVIERTDHYVVENSKVARKMIKRIHPKKPQPSLRLYELNKFTDAHEMQGFLNPCLEGHNMGLMSDAGVPGVADPGSEIIALAHSKGIRVQPLVGPSSILMAMMSSGLNGQNWAFVGYLPVDGQERKKRLKQLELRAKTEGQSQAFIETPYRNEKLIDFLLSQLNANTKLCIAADITQPTEYLRTLTVAEWKKTKRPDLHKRPCMFIIG